MSKDWGDYSGWRDILLPGGGSFGSGFATGALSSAVGSGAGRIARNLNKTWTGVVQIGAGSVSGGAGSVLAGGNFWDGLRQGAITAALNHFAHEIIAQKDPLKRHAEKAKHTLDEWVERYEDMSWYEIATEAGWKDVQPLGPHKDWRYIKAPLVRDCIAFHLTFQGFQYSRIFTDKQKSVALSSCF